jgi:non-ribosomal peptide synthase protein (TIGR01720 family)
MSTHEPAPEGIAVIGMAGRFPGAASVEALWRVLEEGREGVTFFTPEALAAAGVRAETLADPDYVPAGGVLEGVELFDAAFFSMTPAEAALTPPEHRLFLECAREALEGAGHAARGKRVGVFAGVGFNSYLAGHVWPALARDGGDAFQAMLANAGDHLATRVAYRLDLRGPCLTVQTACSTSLVAIHYACQSLASGECDVAVAGGASVGLPQLAGYRYEEGGILSSDGHCRPFDARAEGTVSASGVALVVLRRLEDALADGDPVDAVILGSAVNNDGAAKVGYTAPSVDGQAAVIAEALAVAGVEPETVGYVEAHGTGTALGDPIEVAALARVYGAGPPRPGTCVLGALKGNLGHMDAAAGAAGLIKTVLSLRHGRIPGTLHFQTPHPEIPFADTPFHLSAGVREWPAGATPRRAAVSSFGIGGTNAHVVLEEAPARVPSPTRRPWHLLPLSTRSAAALEPAAAALAAALRADGAPALADAAHTLQAARQPFPHRRAVVCDSAGAGAAALEGGDPGRVLSGVAEGAAPPVAFLFPGQGSQHVGMGEALYRSEPAFRDAVDRCAELLHPHLGLDLRSVLYPAEGEREGAARRLRKTALAQPALFTVEYALAALWAEWGVRPRAMLGHSIGEYVAACLAGVFTLGDALALVALRGKLMQALPAGAMLSVPLAAAEARALLPPELSLAAENAPKSCVVSGPEAAVAALEALLVGRGVRARRLHTSHAFHSAMMEPALEAFEAAVARTPRGVPEIPFVSNLTGRWILPEEAADPAYWARHLRETVRFGEGLGRLGEIPDVVLLEVGPGQTLCALADEQPEEGPELLAVPSMRPPREAASDAAVLLGALARLWARGVEVDWSGYWKHERRVRVRLPTHPMLRERHWIDAPARIEAPATAAAAAAPAPSVEAASPPPDAPLPSATAAPAAPAAPAPRSRTRSVTPPPAPPAFEEHPDAGLERLLMAQIGVMSKQVGLLREEEEAAECDCPDMGAAPPPPVDGAVALSPIQHWFFAQARRVPEHFNQALRLEVMERVDPARLREALGAVVERHEALRTRYLRDGDGLRAHAGPAAGAFVLAEEDLTPLRPAAREAAMERTGAAVQAGLGLEGGPLLRAVLFECGAERPQRLLLAVHHLAVDIASWGVLLDDLSTACLRLARGEPPELAPATPFGAWTERLARHARSPAVQGELGLWLADGRADARPLPRDFPEGRNLEGATLVVEASLGLAESRALLGRAAGAFGAQANDLLLAALGSALAAWAGGPVVVEMEGHGREDLFADVDTSRTVGWFTTLVPLVLGGDGGDPRAAVARVRDRLRELPAGGIGYGLLRWLGGGEAQRGLAALPAAEVSFNYAGRHLGGADAGGLFARPTAHATGPAASPDDPRAHLLEVLCAVSAKRLEVTVRYAAAIHRTETIEGFTRAFMDALRALLAAAPAQPRARPPQPA